ncbi:hypothetical protein M758_4G077200 [Ceratodon purpureus]|uniref:Lectin n=1 Tax=Ceratodon purpureus TaxID=3225 RepID=A0A8T0I6Q4_CERPU|nr:hypothetical protein KC19_4G076900 [Ceratodon purpureus]KAG0618603.1 hypothetical protein M758_4G077200 [Ceratodon purpureus]
MAPYSIHVKIIQNNPSNWYRIVEETVFSDGTWSKCGSEHTLTIDRSGTSGMLRFTNPTGDFFLVALGVHNYKRWCDIVPDASTSMTGVQVNPLYYASGDGNRNGMLWKQLANLEVVTAKGVHIKVDYYKEDGNTLYATITVV